MVESVKDAVFWSLDNAKENGADFNGMTDEEVAIDLLDLDADLEKFGVEEIEPHVREWRSQLEK